MSNVNRKIKPLSLNLLCAPEIEPTYTVNPEIMQVFKEFQKQANGRCLQCKEKLPNYTYFLAWCNEKCMESYDFKNNENK